MAVSFLFSMNLETHAARHFFDTTSARYAAEAGISHARAVLAEDQLGSYLDDRSETWVTQFQGSDADVDDDDIADSRWWAVLDRGGDTLGRYAAQIVDEAGKINLNTALADPEQAGVDAPDLTTLLGRVNISASAATSIEQFRYGPDGKAGEAGVDDDEDGTFDDVDEYQPSALRGDDRRIENLEELLDGGGIDDRDTLNRLAEVATVYSWDSNVSLTGLVRLNINTATAEELLGMLLERGGEQPWQMAANMADYVDDDLAISRVTKVSKRYGLDEGTVTPGMWQQQTTPVLYYTAEPHGSSLSWEVDVVAGTFRVLVHGIRGTVVGDVSLAGQTKPLMDPGESFGEVALASPLTVQVSCPDTTEACAFSGIELVATEPTAGLETTTVRGIEAVRINEVMVEPVLSLTAQEAECSGCVLQASAGWACDDSGCSNSGGGTARWTWEDSRLRGGKYYVRVFGRSEHSDDTVGLVDDELLASGELVPDPVLVTEFDDQGALKGRLELAIGKNAADGTYYFQSLEVSLQPDAEYVELINLSEAPIDCGGWTIEDTISGIKGTIPSLPEAVIAPHQTVLLAVDLDDYPANQTKLQSNGISVASAFDMNGEAAVELEFSLDALDPDHDWLTAVPPAGQPLTVALRTKEGVLADEVQYTPAQIPTTAFQSLEKGDPSVVVDDDGDGLDDGWYPSLSLYTPGLPNNNDGLIEELETGMLAHDPAIEVTVVNRPLRSVGELAGLPSGLAWSPVSSTDLANLADLITIDGLRLEVEDHLTEPGSLSWNPTLDGYAVTCTEEACAQTASTWEWTDVPEGQYRLSVYGDSGQQMSVRWSEDEAGAFSEWTPSLTTDEQGRIVIGQVTVGLDASPANTLRVQMRCDFPRGICRVGHVMLDPRLTLVGLVNINTASLDALLSLPGMTDAVAQRLITGRPYGDLHHKKRGIGDLLMGSVLGDDEDEQLSRFRQLAHLITVRSQVFQIMSAGASGESGRPSANQRIQAVIER